MSTDLSPETATEAVATAAAPGLARGGIAYRSPADPAELAEAFRVFARTMLFVPDPGPDLVGGLVEHGRWIAAFDGEQVVGGADSYSSWLVVPGGRRSRQAAVTHVGVLPTHTRRGIVTELLTRQLRRAYEDGEVLASLRASEGTIYERFGYGVASRTTSLEVDRARARLRALPVTPGSRLRLVAHADRWPAVQHVQARANWVGAIHRPDGWWLAQQARAVTAPGPTYAVVHSTGGVDDGYAIYRPDQPGTWWPGDRRRLVVDEFMALTPTARAGLLRHFVELDLPDVVHFASVALDAPVTHQLTDPRAVRWGSPRDETWLRLVDVPGALAERSFAEAEPVRVAVTDTVLPQNEGTYEVSAAGVCRTDEAADLVVDVSVLGAVHLGDARWWQLAEAGRVEQRTSGAVARADRLWAATRLPWSGTSF